MKLKLLFLVVGLFAASLFAPPEVAAQKKITPTDYTAAVGDSIVNDTLHYYDFGRFSSTGNTLTIQVKQTKVSGFVKGYFYLERSGDNLTPHDYKPIVGDTVTLTNDDNIFQIEVPETKWAYYRGVFAPIDSTQTSTVQVFLDVRR